MTLPPRLRVNVDAMGRRRFAVCHGRRATTRSGRCCQPTGPCCERDEFNTGGSTMYLPAGQSFAGSIGLNGGVSVAWRSPSHNSGARFFLDGVLGLLFEENYNFNLDALPIDVARVVNSLLSNGCVAGFSYSRLYAIPGHISDVGNGAPTIAGSYTGQYDYLGPITIDTLLYVREVSITADHPEFPADPSAIVPWTLTLRLATSVMEEFDPEIGDGNGLCAFCTVTIHFGTPCAVNAPNFLRVTAGPNGLLTNEGAGEGDGDFHLYELGMVQAFEDFFAFVTPIGGLASAAGGSDALSWRIGVAGTDPNPPVPVVGGPPATNQATASASFQADIAATYGAEAFTAFGVCLDYLDLIAACNPTGANACCAAWECGKVNPAQPLRWTRRQTLTGAIFDLDPNNPGAPAAAGWSAANTIDDIVNMAGGTPDCGISPTTAASAFGGSFAPDRLSQSRVLVMQGTTLPESLGFWANRVIVEPIGTDLARRWRATIEAVVRWDRAGAGGNFTTLGTLRIVAETPVLGAPPIGDQAPMTVTAAFFRWTNLPINPVGGEGFALDTAVNPDPEDALDVVALANFLPGSRCLSTIQVYAESGLLVDTQRFGWVTDSTTVATPGTRRLIRIRVDSPIQFGLLNVGICAPAQAAQQQQCEACGGPVVGGRCIVCGAPSERPCVGCGKA